MIRPAKTADIKSIRKIIDLYTLERRLLTKETVTLYEDVQEFFVAEENGEVVGCGALHVLWEDLGEVRTVAVLENQRGKKLGHQIMDAIIARAKVIGLKRLFFLTFETKFFASHGFMRLPVPRLNVRSIKNYLFLAKKVSLSS